jgi:hypothetical protein
MNRTFRKLLGFSASVILLAGGALTMSATSASAATPNAPTNVSVTFVTIGAVSVSFTGDGDPGAQYTVSCTSSVTGPSVYTAMGPSSPIVVTGFENVMSQTVTCTVAETNSADITGPCSNPASTNLVGISGEGCVASLTAPTNLSVAPGEMSATVSWAPVTSNPPGCLQGYVVTPSGSGTPIEILGPGTTTVISGLTDGATVTYTVAGANGGGVGPASASTTPITIGAPAAPSAITAFKIARNAVKVAFNAPNTNGASINGYGATCRSSNGGAARTTLGKASPFMVKRLTPGKTYTCVVVAANSRGVSPASAPSAAVRA